ncbi:MAG: hypothetical protein ACC612_12155 [Methanomethylovorans sp.]|uniref:hypothetical protein n=1 Tax=Methanomethylovorans sp. TaxID=2758717 RepID=UPI0035308E52
MVNEYKKQKGISEVPIIYSIPEIPAGGEIISYSFKINDDGTTSQYVGIVGDKESVSKVHERSDEWYSAEVVNFKVKQTEDTTSNDIDAFVSSKSGTEWSQPCYFYNDYYLSPYGGVMNNYELYVLMNDGSNTLDWFAILQESGLEPGYRAYPISPWKNDLWYAYQKWCNGGLGNEQLFKFKPSSSISGEYSSGFSISGGSGGVSASISWTYSQPDVSTLCYSSTNTDIAYWKMTCNSNAAKTSTSLVNPGSTASGNQHTTGNYKILDVKTTGIFRKDSLNSKILSTTSSPYISYS